MTRGLGVEPYHPTYHANGPDRHPETQSDHVHHSLRSSWISGQFLQSTLLARTFDDDRVRFSDPSESLQVVRLLPRVCDWQM